MLTMTLSQHLTLHWLNLQIEATHTQDEGFERDSRDQTCTHEEADTRMFLHAKHAAIGGSKSINIVSSDTDVVVIGVAVFDDLNVDHLWMTFG
jgi:hypothetical protein